MAFKVIRKIENSLDYFINFISQKVSNLLVFQMQLLQIIFQ